MNETRKFLVYADDVNSVIKNIHITRKNTDPLLATTTKTGLGFMKYIFMSYHKIPQQNHYIHYNACKNVTKFKCLG
jgi:hypothetical protein